MDNLGLTLSQRIKTLLARTTTQHFTDSSQQQKNKKKREYTQTKCNKHHKQRTTKPHIKLDKPTCTFTPFQSNWIQANYKLHKLNQNRQNSRRGKIEKLQ